MIKTLDTSGLFMLKKTGLFVQKVGHYQASGLVYSSINHGLSTIKSH